MVNKYAPNNTKSIDNLNELQKNYEDLQKRVEDLEKGGGSGGTSFDLENLPIVDFTGITPSTNQASVVGAGTANLVYETTSYNKSDLNTYLQVESDPSGELGIGLPLMLYIAIDNKIIPLRVPNCWQNEQDNDYHSFNVQEFWTDLTINNVKYTSGYLISGDHTKVRLELYS